MNTDWTEGYVAELAYPHAYIAELNPLRLQLPFLRAGLAVPEVRTACELGFGQGLSVNIHAAASPVAWHGNDFNPDQALHANALATASGARLGLTDEAFADFCVRDDLPDFDFIGLNGVWSWVSDQNRALIVDFIRRKLKLGGVVYVGYNTQPGWAASIPVRELLLHYAQHVAAPGDGISSRIQAAVAFAEDLLASDPAFARANPSMAALVASMKGQDTNYLAHEFFNSSWRPMSFTDMAAALQPAKLRYACSGHHDIDRLNLSPQQQSLLNGIGDPVFRESVRDFCVNQQFRKDYWVKGARPLNPLEHVQAMRALRVVLQTPRADVASAVVTELGYTALDPAVFGPLLDALADHVPQSLGELEQACTNTPAELPQIVEALALLESNGDISAVQTDAEQASARPHTDRLNIYLLGKALGSGDIAHLASPLTGGAVLLNRIEQLFLCSALETPCEVSDLAPRVWQVLAPQGKKLVVNGQALGTDADNLAELDRLAQVFVQHKLPVLQALGVCPGAVLLDSTHPWKTPSD